MKKHSFTMVFLLILLLSLISAVSACDNSTLSQTDSLSLIEDDTVLEVVNIDEDNAVEYESPVLPVEELDDAGSLVSIDAQSVSEINNKNSQSLLNKISDDASVNDASYSFIRNDNPAILSYCNVELKNTDGIVDSQLSLSDGFLNNYEINTADTCGQNSFEDYSRKFDLPLGKALSVSRDFDDDAFTLKSQDKSASVAVDMVDKSQRVLSNSNINFEEIGVNASKNALNYFKSQGIDIENNYPYLYVSTSAGFVKIKGLDTSDVLKGILKGLGSKFNKKHLKTVDYLSKDDLIFYFKYLKTKDTYALKYENGEFKVIKQFKKDVKGYTGSFISKTDEVSPSEDVLKNDTSNNTEVLKKSEASKSENFSQIAQNQVHSNVNPFNIVYTVIAILIVCVIFGAGYRKH